MAAFEWWRSWHGAPVDLKWPVIAAKSGVKVGVVSAMAWALMDYASQHAVRGTVTGFDEEAYAIYSGFPESEVHAVIVAMTDKGVIKDGRLTNWEKRQPKREDNSAARVTRHRETQRAVTQCNADGEGVTIYSPSPSVSVSDSLINLNQENENNAEPEFVSTPFTRMSALVSNKIHLTRENTNSQDKWDLAINQLVEAGITEADIDAAVAWLTKEGRTILGAQSIVNSCAVEKSKRERKSTARPPDEPHYAEVF